MKSATTVAAAPEEPAKADPFDEIDFGSFFDDYLDPGFKSPASESIEKPSFETFLSSPVTLADHLQSQLAVLILPEFVRQAANSIIGNLEESGYLMTPLEEIAVAEGLSLPDMRAGLKAVQSLEPTGVGAMNLRECLLLQLEETRRPRFGGLEDCSRSAEAARNPATYATYQGARASLRTYTNCRKRNSPLGSRARPALFRRGGPGKWSRTFTSPKTATTTSSR